MTLREIFNAILDHPIQFESELNPWALAVGATVSIAVMCFMYWWYEVR